MPIVSCNQNINKVMYSGFTISKIYACGGSLVWSGGTTPSGDARVTIVKVGGDVRTSYCNNPRYSGHSEISQAEIKSLLPEIGVSHWYDYIESITFGSCPNLDRIDDNLIPSDGNTTITSLTFDNSSVSEIDVTAFAYLHGLTDLHITENITTIGAGAFRSCSALTAVTIESGITSIGSGAFMECSSLEGVTIWATTPPTLGENAFLMTNDCPIYVPCLSVDAYKAANVWTTYANRIFPIAGSCTLYRWQKGDVTDFICDDGDSYYKEYYQESTDSGTTWTNVIPLTTRQSQDVIEYNCPDCIDQGNKMYATYNTLETLTLACDGNPLGQFEPQHGGSPAIERMVTVEIGACSEAVPYTSFSVATNLTAATMYEGITSIGQSAFANLTKLKKVVIPNSVTLIGAYAFQGCSGLTSCTIGSGVTEVGESAFSGCTKIENNLNLPNITTIRTTAFRSCKKLKSVTLGSGCTRVENGAFADCSGLTAVTVEATSVPTCGTNVFLNTTCPIYVLPSLVESYKTTYAWNQYSEIGRAHV